MTIGQTSLPETCPVCAHTPISSDLCKPNKALRTTLKAFLRTEEKKREKDRPSTASQTPAPITSADGNPAQREVTVNVETSDGHTLKNTTEHVIGPNTEVAEQPLQEANAVDQPANNGAETDLAEAADPVAQVRMPPLFHVSNDICSNYYTEYRRRRSHERGR